MADFVLEWNRGRAEVQALAGMLGPVTFALEDGREVQPFAIAPWSDDQGKDYEALPEILKRLRGEWPCVPFGAPETPAGLPAGWSGSPVEGAGSDFHGFGSHNHWHLVEEKPGALTLGVEYPADHGIASLRRTIEGVPDQPAIRVTLEVVPRHDVALPIALHPVFRLPDDPGAMHIDAGPVTGGRVFPLPVEPGVSRLEPDATFGSLTDVPSLEGSTDLSRLPLTGNTEELVQLLGPSGTVTLSNVAEGYRAMLGFDPRVFTGLLLWVSNRGRGAYPWNNRFLGLGVEPVRAAFDLGPAVSCNPENPIARAGHATCLQLTAGRPFTTSYSIAVEHLAR